MEEGIASQIPVATDTNHQHKNTSEVTKDSPLPENVTAIELQMDVDSESIHKKDTNSEIKYQETDCEIRDTITLIDLPEELLIYLASFLDSRDIIETLSHVCQYLNELFSNERFWKTRISLRWPKPYPVLLREDFSWQKACLEREEIHKMWSMPEDNFHHFVCQDGFYACVDVVHLMKNGQFLAVGSRDRHMNVLDLSIFDPEQPDTKKDMLIYSNNKAHKGWVWSMASYGDTLVSGSWDTYIKFWDTGDGIIQPQSEVKLTTAILGLYAEPGFVAAGGYDKRLYMFDPRTPESLIRKLYHQKPLLSVAADDKYVITGSEDNVVSIYDRVAGKNYKKIDIDSFVMDVSYGDGQLWIGDKEGRLRIIDARDGLFDENNILTIETGHTRKITGVVHTDGGIFTCSEDATVKVFEPTLESQVINTFKSHREAISGISYKNGILASAGTDISVGVWLPKSYSFQ